MPYSTKGRSMPRRLVGLLALACGLAVANIYYAYPLLANIADTFDISYGAVGVIVTVTQIAYGVGLLLLVPLGDIVDGRRLVVAQWLLSVVALVIVATAGSSAVLLIGMAAVGLLAVVIQVQVAYAAALAAPDERGRVVGSVTSGVVLGILLSRTVAGVIADLAGWRAVFLGSAVAALAISALLWRALPRRQAPPRAMTYRQLLRSTLALYHTEPVLRVRATLAMLVFAALGVLWSSLVLTLSAPPFSLSTTTIGLFGFVGVAGAVAAAGAGRLADRRRGHATTGVALVLMLVAWLPIGLVHQSLAAFVVGLMLVDLAVQAVHVTSQSMIYAINAEARSRLLGAYMIFYSIGTAGGAVVSTATYASAGWTGVCVLGAVISGIALLYWACHSPLRGLHPAALTDSTASPGRVDSIAP